MRRAGFIRNDLDPDALLTACRQSLDDGHNLIIFPEGTRSRPGSPPQFRRGFANLAVMTGAPVQPIIITCEPATLLKGDPWWSIPGQKPRFRITVDECLDPDTYLRYPHRSLAA
jgi:1-acyl-sn-glycerol-3-phosphate acyltransferase